MLSRKQVIWLSILEVFQSINESLVNSKKFNELLHYTFVLMVHR